MAFDSLEIQIAAAVQRFTALQRRAVNSREPAALLTKALAELGTAFEQVRAAQEQLIESRSRLEQVQQELRQQTQRYWDLFDAMPEPYVVTKPDSTIVEANRAAAELLNVSQRFLPGKMMSVFVCEDRTQFLLASSRAAAENSTLDLNIKLRPRERAPQSIDARVSGCGGSLRWILRTARLPATPHL